MQQIYPSVTHPYQFELNKDFNFSAAHYIPFEEGKMYSYTRSYVLRQLNNRW